MIIGVDRLDYTKGIPHRLEAFARMLDQHRDMHGRVSFVQISNPSRARVPEYIREREAVERLAGRINGRMRTVDGSRSDTSTGALARTVSRLSIATRT